MGAIKVNKDNSNNPQTEDTRASYGKHHLARYDEKNFQMLFNEIVDFFYLLRGKDGEPLSYGRVGTLRGFYQIVMRHDFKNNPDKPFPGMESIARRLPMTLRGAQAAKSWYVEQWLMNVEERPGYADLYEFAYIELQISKYADLHESRMLYDKKGKIIKANYDKAWEEATIEMANIMSEMVGDEPRFRGGGCTAVHPKNTNLFKNTNSDISKDISPTIFSNEEKMSVAISSEQKTVITKKPTNGSAGVDRFSFMTDKDNGPVNSNTEREGAEVGEFSWVLQTPTPSSAAPLPSATCATKKNKQGNGISKPGPKRLTENQLDLEKWVIAILDLFGKANEWETFASSSKSLGRYLAAAKDMRTICASFAEDHPELSAYLTPEIMNEYWGTRSNKNGWLFRSVTYGGKGISSDMQTSPALVVRYFIEFLYTLLPTHQHPDKFNNHIGKALENADIMYATEQAEFQKFLQSNTAQ